MIGLIPAPLVACPEWYSTNLNFNGTLYVHYEYDSHCLVPALNGISCSNSVMELDIQNLSVGSSNKVQRSFNLLSDEWTDVGGFLSTGWKTNWSESMSNEWSAVFYRVLSK